MTAVRLQMKESSYVKYESLVRRHIEPDLGHLKTNQLTTGQLDIFVKQQLQAGSQTKGRLAPKTVRDILAVLKLIIAWANRHHYFIPARPEEVHVKLTDQSVQVLTQQDQESLELFIEDDLDRRATGVLLTLYTGIRVGELCALRQKDLKLTEAIMEVQQTLQRIPNLAAAPSEPKTKVLIESPKSACSNRMIPLPDLVVKRLKQYEMPDPEAFFLTGSRDRFIEPRGMNMYLRRLLKSCELPPIHFHELRHTFATRCIEKNFDVKALSEILGHASVNITLNRYVHVSMEEKRRNMKKLSG